MDKTIYLFTAAGEFAGATLARRSPLEPDVFLIPGNATETPPPEVPAGQVAVFRDGAWQLVVDDRGRWFTADGGIIDVHDLGAKPDAAVTRNAPPDAHMRWDGVIWVADQAAASAALRAALAAVVQAHLDSAARDRGFDNIFTELLWRNVKHEDVYILVYFDFDEDEKVLGKY